MTVMLIAMMLPTVQAQVRFESATVSEIVQLASVIPPESVALGDELGEKVQHQSSLIP